MLLKWMLQRLILKWPFKRFISESRTWNCWAGRQAKREKKRNVIVFRMIYRIELIRFTLELGRMQRSCQGNCYETSTFISQRLQSWGFGREGDVLLFFFRQFSCRLQNVSQSHLEVWVVSEKQFSMATHENRLCDEIYGFLIKRWIKGKRFLMEVCGLRSLSKYFQLYNPRKKNKRKPPQTISWYVGTKYFWK